MHRLESVQGKLITQNDCTVCALTDVIDLLSHVIVYDVTVPGNMHEKVVSMEESPTI